MTGHAIGRAIKHLAGLPGLLLAVPAAFMLTACSTTERVFEPACIAFAGDRVVLGNGRFEWDRFTDEVRIGDDGEPVDPYPDYPKTGRYEIADGRVVFSSSSGDAPAAHRLHVGDSGTYLLTEKEHAALDGGQDIPECALREVRVNGPN